MGEAYGRSVKHQTERLDKANSSSVAFCWPSGTHPTISPAQILLFVAAVLCVLSTLTVQHSKRVAETNLECCPRPHHLRVRSQSGLHETWPGNTQNMSLHRTYWGWDQNIHPSDWLISCIYNPQAPSYLSPQKYRAVWKKKRATPRALQCHWKMFSLKFKVLI